MNNNNMVEKITDIVVNRIILNIDSVYNASEVNYTNDELVAFMKNNIDAITQTISNDVTELAVEINEVPQALSISLSNWFAKQNPNGMVNTQVLFAMISDVFNGVMELYNKANTDKSVDFVSKMYDIVNESTGMVTIADSAYSVNGKCIILGLPKMGYTSLALVPLKDGTLRVEITTTPVYIVDNNYPSTILEASDASASMIISFINNGNGYGLNFNTETGELVA